MTMSYIEAIGNGFPGVDCHAVGDGTVYEDIVWDNGLPLPSKEALDAWVASNSELDRDRRITVLAFRNRFTLEEKAAIEFASTDKPNETTQQRMLSATLRALMTDLSTANYVDLNREDTINGINLLETYSIIGVGRANEILNASIDALERPQV
jgi:hypothetical protein